MNLGLSQKVAIVAGGSRGCGLGIAQVLAEEDVNVVLSGRLPHKVEAAERQIADAGGKALGVVADMTTPEGAKHIHAATVERFGDPDILVTNSPGAVPDPETNRWRGFENSSDEDFVEIYHNFVMSVVYLTRLALPAMKERRWAGCSTSARLR